MSKQKATDIAILKRHFRESDNGTEDAVLELLEPEEKMLYENLMHTTWVPTDSIAKLYQAIGDTLYPGDRDKLVKVGKLAGEKSFTGVYKTFLRTPTIDSIKQRMGMIWNTYHAQGRVTVRESGETRFDLQLDEYPEIPDVIKQITTGHLQALLEVAGLKQVTVSLKDEDTQTVCWTVEWAG